MTDEKTQVEDDFSEEAVPVSNWMKFEEIGDYVKGTLFKKPYIKEGDGEFKAQYVYELVNAEAVSKGARIDDGEIFLGVSIDKEFVWSRLNRCKIGQRMGLKFMKEIPPSKKGFRPAKSLMPNIWGMDMTFKAMEEFGGEEVTAEEAGIDVNKVFE